MMNHKLELLIIVFAVSVIAAACFFISHIFHNRKALKFEKYTKEVHYYLEKILQKSQGLKLDVLKDVDLSSPYSKEARQEIDKLKDSLEDKDLEIQGMKNELQLVKAKISKGSSEKITYLERRVLDMEKENYELVNLIETIRDSLGISDFGEESNVLQLDVNQNREVDESEQFIESSEEVEIDRNEDADVISNILEKTESEPEVEKGEDDEMFDLFKKMMG